jgi:hypothetical protein
MKTPSLRPFAFLLLPVVIGSCTSTTAYRHKNGTVTVTQRGWNAKPGSYWITGATAGTITPSENLLVFRKDFIGKPLPAVPVKCSGYIDTTEADRIEIRLVERKGGGLLQAWANGRHKLVDENAPKPFYHWLIP